MAKPRRSQKDRQKLYIFQIFWENMHENGVGDATKHIYDIKSPWEAGYTMPPSPWWALGPEPFCP